MLSLVVRADAGRYRVEGCALCALLFSDTPTPLPARRLVQRSETVDQRQAVLPILRRSLLNKPGLRGHSVAFGIAGEVVGGWENCSISPGFRNTAVVSKVWVYGTAQGGGTQLVQERMGSHQAVQSSLIGLQNLGAHSRREQRQPFWHPVRRCSPARSGC